MRSKLATAADHVPLTRSRSASETDPVGRLPDDEVFEVLTNQRRRRVLEYLCTHEGPVRLGTLADHIAGLETGKDAALVTSTERKRVYVSLYQCHLPKMDSYGVVRYDKDRGTIERGPAASCTDQYLTDDRSRDRPKALTGLLSAGWLGLLVALLPAVGPEVGLLVGLGAAAVAHVASGVVRPAGR